MAKSSSIQIEQDEKKLLYELTRNAKENLDTIAKNCGFSRQKAWRMMKQLEVNKMVWGYTAVFNEEKMGLMHFTLMVTRTMKKPEENIVDTIVSRKTQDIATEVGVAIESSYYTHGKYDWILTFTAENLTKAKKFSDSLIALHPGYIEEITLLQTLMFVRKHYILNPERKKLKEFM